MKARAYTTAPSALDMIGTVTLNEGIVDGPAGRYREVELDETNVDAQIAAYEAGGFDAMNEEDFNYCY